MMIDAITEFVSLLLGSMVLRPYVYLFFLTFAALGLLHLGFRRWMTFTLVTWTIAFLCEYSSTRNGFPFGLYTYIDSTRNQELWISNVPFWDSLSFVFLSYFSFIMASAVLMPEKRGLLHHRLNAGMARNLAPVLGGFLMMLLDLVIDPVTNVGEKWFLGKMYFYPDPGLFFGVTLANFAGWFFVGFVTQLALQQVFAFFGMPDKKINRHFIWACFGVYAGVFVFMLVITVAIGEWGQLFVHLIVSGTTLYFLARALIQNLALRSESAPIWICTGTASEARACERGVKAAGRTQEIRVLATGVGLKNAKAFLENELKNSVKFPSLIISSGFAYASDRDVSEGQFVMSSSARPLGYQRNEADCSPAPQSGVHRIPEIFSSSSLVLPHKMKVESNIYVDMESSALAEVAREHQIRFLAIRMVTDTPTSPLPSCLETFTQASEVLSAWKRVLLGIKGLGQALLEPQRVVRLLRSGPKWLKRLESAWQNYASKGFA